MSGEISPKRDAKQKPNQSSKTSKSIDFSYSLSSDMDVDSRKQRRKSRILLVDGSFDLRHMTRDFWLDHRQSVQNGTRCVRCTDTGVRYACTSRSLREWDDEESKRIIKSFKAIFKVQTDLARVTAFVQPVVAARLHQRDMLVIAPLPPNMYLSDLKKLVVHLSHNSVRYYAACILLGLEFMRHSCIYHGNLSLCSIALDYYGRPQITDFDTSLCEKIGEASHQLDALRYAAMLGVLHCDNIRHFSISHMHSTADDHRRRDVFVGICPKCRLTAECMDPKLCDCHNFGALVRYIRNKIVTKEAMRRILESLQPSWMEADLCYSWSRIPRAEEEKILELELMRSASQLAGYSRVSSQFIDPVDDFEGFESDSDAVGQIRISRASMGAASSFAAGTAMTGFGGSQGATGNFAQRDAIKEAKNERLWQRRQELQRARVSSSMYFDQASKGRLKGWSTASMKSIRESWKTPLSATADAENGGTPKSASVSESGSMLEPTPQLPAGHRSKRAQPQTVGLVPATQHSTPPLPKPRLAARPLPKRPPVAGQHLSWRLDFDDEGRPMPLGPGKSALMPQTNCSASLAGKNAQKPKSSGSGFSNDFNLDAGYGEFEFKGYQLMMEHNYFINTNWEALEIAQPPEGLWFAHSLIMQGYNREPTPSKPATNLGDDADRMVGSYFTSRSRVLYSLFG
ncbi:hypothetical protein BOX15_Mlig007152g1 [Macrostomum lignano]|uniref:Uncharacterized protein n=2 Tax=Macrostomum lignano TaxID=282301 RepID=A0A267GVL9_9PLAT|nr:hypothetical protein BOX15_Mlig007152g1 [Macrostomum lignano]